MIQRTFFLAVILCFILYLVAAVSILNGLFAYGYLVAMMGAGLGAILINAYVRGEMEI